MTQQCVLPSDQCHSPTGSIKTHLLAQPFPVVTNSVTWRGRYLTDVSKTAASAPQLYHAAPRRLCELSCIFGVLFYRCTKCTEFYKTMTWALCIVLINSSLSLGCCVLHTNKLFSSFQAMGTSSARASILVRSSRGIWSLHAAAWPDMLPARAWGLGQPTGDLRRFR